MRSLTGVGRTLILATVLAVGAVWLAGCGGDDNPGSTTGGAIDAAINGTWVTSDGNEEWTFNNGSFELVYGGSLFLKGTYTTNDGKLTYSVTHAYGGYTSFAGLLQPKWYTRSELKAALNAEETTLNGIFFTESGTYLVSGSTLIIGTTIYNKKSGGGNDNNNTNIPSSDVSTGSVENRKYKVEVYNVNSTTFTYLTDTYADKSYQNVVRTDVISRGGTVLNSYTNQTLSGVISKLSDALTGIGATSLISGMTDRFTEVLQTNNRTGHCMWANVGSTYRFFYVNRTSTDNYTVEVYNINSATYTYLTNTYANKSYQDVVRADVISRGGTVVNSYTNQTFSGVISKLSDALTSIGATNLISWMTDKFTEMLQTNNRSGHCMWSFKGSTYRFFYVSQE